MDSATELLTKKQKFFLILLVFANILLAIFETIGIGALPVLLTNFVIPDPVYLNNLYYKKIIKLGISNSNNFLLIFSVLIFIFFIFKNIFFVFVKWFESSIVQSITLNVSSELFKGYVNLPYAQHQLKNPSIILRNITSESQNFTTLIVSFASILRESLVVSFLFLLLFINNKIISVSVFIFLLLVLGIFYLTMKNGVFRRGQYVQNLMGDQLKLISQSFGAIKYIKIFNQELSLNYKYYKNLKKILNQGVALSILQTLPKLFLEILAVGSIILISLFAIYFKGMEPAYFISFLALFSLVLIRIVPSFNVISSALSLIQFNSASKNILIQEFKFIKQKIFEKKVYKLDGQSENIFNRSLKLSNISFFYPGTKKNILKNISFDLKPNTSIAIIGETGAGKSTLIDIILGLLQPSGGKILIDGIPMKKKIVAWQNILGFIPQDIYLDDDTIKKNIIFSDNETDIDEIYLKQVLKLTLLDNFVNSLPKKIDTEIGNRGIRLSGGQIQRLGIARCLYRRPRVIVMDEATSSLDYKSERLIIDSINNIKHNTTFITIAHRLSTIRKCDIIYFLREGRIIDQGSYNQLKKRHRKFFLNL